jgi:hypothetical protein
MEKGKQQTPRLSRLFGMGEYSFVVTFVIQFRMFATSACNLLESAFPE